MALLHIDAVSWSAGLHQNVATWDDPLTAKAAADTATLIATEAVGRITGGVDAVDTATLVATDTSRPPVAAGVIPVSSSDTATLVASESAQAVELVPISASDTATPVITERYLILNGSEVPKSASDTALLSAVETPIDARIITVDDVGTPALVEVAVPPMLDKPASDTATLVLSESWQILAIEGNSILIPASDTATLVVTDTASQIFQVVAVSASDSALLAVSDIARPPAFDEELSSTDGAALQVTDTAQAPLVVHDAVNAADTALLVATEGTPVIEIPTLVSASDTATLIAVDTARPITIFEAPPVGVLPPGWVEREETELTGIERPKRYEPGNVQPIKGWFRRTYWAVYDENGRLRATDRWRDAARAQAWTQYHAGKQAAAA